MSRFASASFVLKVIILSMLCVALNEARADVQGIPADSRFPGARYPFARVLKGCTEWRLPPGISAKWGAVDFNGACREHDLCFHTTGASWGACNASFLRDMRAACDRDLKVERLERGIPGGPDGQALPLCYQVADVISARAQQSDVTRRFALAQTMAKAYARYVESLIDAAYLERFRRPPRGDELAEALAALKAGYALGEIRAAVASRGHVGSLRGRLAEQDGVDPFPRLDAMNLVGDEKSE